MTTVTDFAYNRRKVEHMFVKRMSLEDVSQCYWCLARQTGLTWLRTVDFSILTSLSIHSNNFRPHLFLLHCLWNLSSRNIWTSPYRSASKQIAFASNISKCEATKFACLFAHILLTLVSYPLVIGSDLNMFIKREQTTASYIPISDSVKLIKITKNPVMTQSVDITKKELASLIICKLNSMAFVEYCSNEFEFQANISLFRERRVWCRQNLLNNQKFRMIFRDNLHLDKEPEPGNSWVESGR